MRLLRFQPFYVALAVAAIFVPEAIAEGFRWQTLDENAFRRARVENKPVYVLVDSFLSELGLATVKSLEGPDTAAFFNSHFICVRVDRDARPDFAAAAQDYLSRVKQLPGWPANVWLTPEGKPFDGANYLPAVEEWGKKSLSETAKRNADAWGHDPAGCRRAGNDAMAMLRPPLAAAAGYDPSRLPGVFAAAAQVWRAAGAPHGGFGEPPIYAQPELLRFLLLRGGADRALALTTLRWLGTSALRDPLDGGFFTYLRDGEGHLPYPQKTLLDQARLALVFLDAQSYEPEPLFATCARGALDYVLVRLKLAGGTFAAAEDGTGEGREDSFAWTAAEVRQALGPQSALFEAAFAVAPSGNISPDSDPSGQFAGKNLLRRVGTIGEPQSERLLAESCARLLAIRDRRPAPRRDLRPAAVSHGWLLAAFARAGKDLGDARYVAAARALGRTVSETFVSVDATVRPFSGNEPSTAGPADYAALALGFETLAQAQADDHAQALATRLLTTCDARFLDPTRNEYDASEAQLAAGVFARSPADVLTEHQPSPDAVALLAGPPPEAARRLASGLVLRSQDQALMPGDALLALSVKSSR